jgi:hypothetical protein
VERASRGSGNRGGEIGSRALVPVPAPKWQLLRWRVDPAGYDVRTLPDQIATNSEHRLAHLVGRNSIKVWLPILIVVAPSLRCQRSTDATSITRNSLCPTCTATVPSTLSFRITIFDYLQTLNPPTSRVTNLTQLRKLRTRVRFSSPAPKISVSLLFLVGTFR